MRIRIIPVLCLATLAACRATNAAPDPDTREAPDPDGFPDAEVYSAVLKEAARGYQAPVLFVDRETSLGPDRFAPTPETFDYVHGTALAGVAPETVRSFWERNATTHRVPATLAPTRPYRLLSYDMWGPNEDVRPVFILSRPGYDARGTQALVHVVTACPLCGGAFFYLLRRNADQWTVVRRSAQWYS